MTTREQKEGQAGRGRSTADPGGRHLWRATLIFRLVTMVVGMAYTLVIGPLFEHSTGRWNRPRRLGCAAGGLVRRQWRPRLLI